MPRRRSSLNTSVLRCRQVAISGDAIPLELRQAQPSFGLKCVEALNARIISPKGESNALQSLALEPFYLGAIYHRHRACHRNVAGQYISDYLALCAASLGTSASNAVVAAVSN